MHSDSGRAGKSRRPARSTARDIFVVQFPADTTPPISLIPPLARAGDSPAPAEGRDPQGGHATRSDAAAIRAAVAHFVVGTESRSPLPLPTRHRAPLA
jgi:hypothetical protein